MIDEETMDGDGGRICDDCGFIYIDDYCPVCEEEANEPLLPDQATIARTNHYCQTEPLLSDRTT